MEIGLYRELNLTALNLCFFYPRIAIAHKANASDLLTPDYAAEAVFPITLIGHYMGGSVC